jgi:glycosyltransferase involved in cell wall biosynthesis
MDREVGQITRANETTVEKNLERASYAEIRVLFISGAGGGTRRYRCFQPQEQLELNGIATGFRTCDDGHLFQDILSYDIFILHRVAYTHLIRDVLELVHRRKKITLFETDDLIFEPGLIQYDSYYRHLPSEHVQVYERHVLGCLETLERCDYAVTTTGYLADALRRHGKPVLINRNALGSEFMRLAEEAHHAVKPTDKRLVIGYISGSASHNHDFEAASDALLHVLQKYPHVDLRIVGSLKLSEHFEPFRQRIHQSPFIPWDSVPREIRAMHINLAPLEQDNPFCQSKSEVKYFEAGILGIPTIASRTDAFEFAIRHGETGCLASSTGDWIECLELLITNPHCRSTMGEEARRDVLQNYTPQVRGQQFAEALKDLVANHPLSRGAMPNDQQIERQVVNTLIGYLNEQRNLNLFSNLSREDSSFRSVVKSWQDRIVRQDSNHVLQRALHAVRQTRRSLQAQTVAEVKHLAKKWTRRVYRLTIKDKTYQLIGELTSRQIYGQILLAEAHNLCGVQVLFATFNRINTVTLIFRLKEHPKSETDLVIRTVLAAGLQDNHFFAFTFGPLPDSDGKRYYFSVESPDAVRGDAVGLWACVKRTQDVFYENGHPILGRLAYRALYTQDSTQNRLDQDL